MLERICLVTLVVLVVTLGIARGADVRRGIGTTWLALLATIAASAAVRAADLTPEEARPIAKEAYVYGFPLVENYRVMHAYAVDRNNAEFKAPFNQIKNVAHTFTADDHSSPVANADMQYSFAWLDLRAEPVVLTVPPMEKGRYFSIQLTDLYSHNFDYLSTRTIGNGGGSYVIAGPSWKGAPPKGIRKMLRAETELVLAAYQTQLINPYDLENVKKIQAGYTVRPLSAFLGKPPPPAAPAIDFVAPLTPYDEHNSLAFFGVLNFVLQFCPTQPSEAGLRARLATIGVEPGKPFAIDARSPEMQHALGGGMAEGQGEITVRRLGATSAAALFGTRASFKGDYVNRAAGAQAGIYGQSKEEGWYPVYNADVYGRLFNAADHRYVLHFTPDTLPPVNGFWSLTVYDLPQQLLVPNPLNRYLVNSSMLPDMLRDADGGLTIYIQATSPGADKERNWLPVPNGAFVMALRLHWPKAAAFDGTWTPPPVKPVE
jgi:hypothetical protein